MPEHPKKAFDSIVVTFFKTRLPLSDLAFSKAFHLISSIFSRLIVVSFSQFSKAPLSIILTSSLNLTVLNFLQLSNV